MHSSVTMKKYVYDMGSRSSKGTVFNIEIICNGWTDNVLSSLLLYYVDFAVFCCSALDLSLSSLKSLNFLCTNGFENDSVAIF